MNGDIRIQSETNLEELVNFNFKSFAEPMACVICLVIKFKVKNCSHCEQIFCDECIEKLEKKNLVDCPNCKKKKNFVNLTRAAMNLLNKVKLSCQYYRKGCKEIIYLENFEGHIKDCKYKEKEVQNYVSCDFCNVEYDIDAINDHLKDKMECFKNLAKEIEKKNLSSIQQIKEDIQKQSEVEKKDLKEKSKKQEEDIILLTNKIQEILTGFEQYKTDSSIYIQNLTNEYNNLKRGISETFEKNQVLENQMKLAREELKKSYESSDQIRSLQTLVEESTKKIEVLNKENQEKEKMFTEELTIKDGTINDLTENLRISKEDINILKSKLEVNEKEIDITKEEIAKLKKEITFEQENYAKITPFIEKLKAENESYLKAIREYEKQLLEMDSFYKQKITEINIYYTKEIELVKSQSNDAIKQEKEEYSKKVKELEEKYKSFEEKQTDTNVCEELKEKISVLSKQLEESKELEEIMLKKHIEEIQSHQEKFKVEKENIIKELKATEDKLIFDFTNQLNTIKEENITFKSSVEDEKHKTHEEIALLKKQISFEQEANTKVTSLIEKLKTENDSYINTLKNYEKQFNEMDSFYKLKIAEISNNYSRDMESAKKLVDTNDNMRKENELLNDKIKDSMLNEKKMKLQIEENNIEISELIKNLEDDSKIRQGLDLLLKQQTASFKEKEQHLMDKIEELVILLDKESLKQKENSNIITMLNKELERNSQGFNDSTSKLKSEYTELEKKCSLLLEELDNTRKEKDYLNSVTVNTLTNQLNSEKEKVASLTLKIEELTQENDEKLNSLKMDLGDKPKEIMNLYEEKLRHLREEHEISIAKEKEANLLTLKECENQKEETAKIIKELNAMKQTFADKQSDSKRIYDEVLSAFSNYKEEAKHKEETLMKYINDSESKLKNELEKTLNLSNLIKELEDENLALKKDIESNRTDSYNLNVKNESLLEEITRVEKLLEDSKSKMANQEEVEKNLTLSFREKEKLLSVESEQLRILKEENEDLKLSCESLTSLRDLLETKLSEVETCLRGEKENNKELNSKIDELQMEKSSLLNKLEEREDYLKQIVEKLSKETELATQLSQTLELSKIENEKSLKSISELDLKLKEVESFYAVKLNELAKEKEILLTDESEKIKNLAGENDNLKQLCESLTKSKALLEIKLSELETAIESEKGKSTSLNSKLDQLQIQYTTSINKLKEAENTLKLNEERVLEYINKANKEIEESNLLIKLLDQTKAENERLCKTVEERESKLKEIELFYSGKLNELVSNNNKEQDEVKVNYNKLSVDFLELQKKYQELETSSASQKEFYSNKVQEIESNSENALNQAKSLIEKLNSDILGFSEKEVEAEENKKKELEEMRKSCEEHLSTKDKEIEELLNQLNILKEQNENFAKSHDHSKVMSENMAKLEKHYKGLIIEQELIHRKEKETYDLKMKSVIEAKAEQEKALNDLNNKNKLIIDELLAYQKKSILYRPKNSEQDKMKKALLETDIWEKNLLVQGDFTNSGKDYVDYTISIILDNDVEFKCFRRYKFFYLLNECLQNKYPYLALPKLPEKKFIFLNTADREKKLNFYINYLYSHEQLREVDEFNHFIDEFSFNISYFEKEKNHNFLELPSKEYEKYKDPISTSLGKLIGVKADKNLNNYFILNKRGLFINLHKRFEELQKQLGVFRELLNSSESGNKLMQNSILTFYDLNKEKVEYTDISNRIQKSYSQTSYYLDCLDIIENETNDVVSILESINSAFDRWEIFLKIYEKINKAKDESRRGDFKYNVEKLDAELNHANNINKKFEDSLKYEVANYEKKYTKLGEKLISKFLLLYSFILKKETGALR